MPLMCALGPTAEARATVLLPVYLADWADVSSGCLQALDLHSDSDSSEAYDQVISIAFQGLDEHTCPSIEELPFDPSQLSRRQTSAEPKKEVLRARCESLLDLSTA